MRNLILFTTLVSALGAFVASSAQAQTVRPYWTADHAEQVLLDSDYVSDEAIDDVSCAGRGRARQSPIGTPTYRLFKCRFYYQDWWTDEEETFTAALRVIANPGRYALFAFSDPNFDPSSDCYQSDDPYCSG